MNSHKLKETKQNKNTKKKKNAMSINGELKYTQCSSEKTDVERSACTAMAD